MLLLLAQVSSSPCRLQSNTQYTFVRPLQTLLDPKRLRANISTPQVSYRCSTWRGLQESDRVDSHVLRLYYPKRPDFQGNIAASRIHVSLANRRLQNQPQSL